MTGDPFAPAQRIADAILWEGYVLYPYRATAAKNQMRWQFGVLTPPSFSDAHPGERSSMRTECIVEPGDQARVELRVRFLQVQSRIVEQLVDGVATPVPELVVDGDLWASWDEAVVHERDVTFDLRAGEPCQVHIDLEAGRDVEPIGPGAQLVRQRWPSSAVVQVAASTIPGAHGLARLTASVQNTTEWDGPGASRDDALRRSMVAAHLLLRGIDAGFVSMLDPPEHAAAAVDACRNDGTFPVLVGDPDDPSVMLSSPIILYDHPAVAEQSAGDLCDATEIDEILSLRILTLTDDEKRAARATDARAAAIVDRVEGFSPDVFASLHGEMRLDAPAEPVPWWDPAADDSVDPWADSVEVAGATIAKGSRVRLRPGAVAGRRTDAQDLFLVGREAIVTGVFLDVDGQQHVAVVLDDELSAELLELQGRFMYFHPDEVEALT